MHTVFTLTDCQKQNLNLLLVAIGNSYYLKNHARPYSIGNIGCKDQLI